MKKLRQLFVGLLTALGSSVLVLAAGSLALAEGGISPSLLTTASPETSLTATAQATLSPTASPLPGQTLTLTVTPTAALKCDKTPKDWTPYVVKAGDTLASLAEKAGKSTDVILDANCLYSPDILAGTILYLPITVTATPTSTGLPTALPTLQATYPGATCGRPYGWVTYTVKSGENLYRLSLAFGVSQYQLQMANCLTGTFIYAGQRLYVPNVATRTPAVAATTQPQPSATAMPTHTQPPAASPTATATAQPSATTAPSATATTAVPVNTPAPTATTAATLVAPTATP